MNKKSSDFENSYILDEYVKQSDQQVIDLNKLIIALRTRIAYLEKQIEEREKIPVPKTVIMQIVQLQDKNNKLSEEVEYYKKHVPKHIIINKESKLPTRRGGLVKK